MTVPAAQPDDVDFERHMSLACRDYLPGMAAAAGVALLVATMVLLEGFALQGLTGHLLGGDPVVAVFGTGILRGAGLVAVTYPALVLLRAAGTYVLEMIQARLMIACRDAIEIRIVRCLLRKRQRATAALSIGDLIGRLAVDLPRAMAQREQATALFGSALAVAASMIFIGYHSLAMMLAVVLASGAAAAANAWLARSVEDVDHDFRAASDGARVRIDEMLRSAKELRANDLIEGALRDHAAFLVGRRAEFLRLSRHLARMRGAHLSWPGLAVWGLIGAALLAGPASVLPAGIDPAVLPALLMATIALFGEIARMIESVIDLRLIRVSVDRLRGYAVDTQDLADWAPSSAPYPARVTQIALRNVAFGHDHEAGDLLIEGLLLRGPELVVLAGPSGAGKTTVLDLLAKEIGPRSGRIEINGVPLGQLGRSEHARHVILMPQRSYLPPGRLCDVLSAHLAIPARDRAAAWKERPELRRLLEASGLAGKLLLRARGGAAGLGELLEQEIERHGTGLSGGEHQLIGLVRCLASPAEVVLLDEPTAALDADTARRVVAELRHQAAGRLVICATHDPQLCAAADVVHRLDAGRMVQHA